MITGHPGVSIRCEKVQIPVTERGGNIRLKIRLGCRPLERQPLKVPGLVKAPRAALVHVEGVNIDHRPHGFWPSPYRVMSGTRFANSPSALFTSDWRVNLPAEIASSWVRTSEPPSQFATPRWPAITRDTPSLRPERAMRRTSS